MAHFYTYIDPTKIEAQFAEISPDEKKRKNSVEMASADKVKPQDEDGSSDSSAEEEVIQQSKM